ncbi:hypothetical protein F8M49_22215 [Rhodococcus zopfii]|uniref:Uncharacterized protein n=1 Tax=Rhodococcus zopfii TaxID=43772 RepID=A0ABU3WTU2_9NOCA|nr:hypothetical protein [Rhodococcus zopfii]
MVVKPDLPDNPGPITGRGDPLAVQVDVRGDQSARCRTRSSRGAAPVLSPGDPEPWPGAQIAYGTIVWDLVDNSAFHHRNLVSRNTVRRPVAHELVNIGGDGKTETTETVPGSETCRICTRLRAPSAAIPSGAGRGVARR